MFHPRHAIPPLLALLGLALTLFAHQPAAAPIQPEQARLVASFDGMGGPGTALAYGEDAGVLVAGGQDGRLHYWFKPELLGVRAGNQTPHVAQAHGGPVLALATNGRNVFASAGTDQRIHVWSFAAESIQKTLTVEAGVVRCLAISPDGKTLASAGDDPVISLWDLATGERRTKLEGHRDWVMALAFSPDGTRLASAGYEPVIRLWNIGTTDKLPVIPFRLPLPADRSQHSLCLSFSPDGQQVAVGGTDAQIHLVHAMNGTLIRSLTGHGSSVTGLAFHPTAPFLFTASKDRTLRAWNLTNGQAVKPLEGHEAWVRGLALLENGKLVASVGADGMVKVWDLRPPAK